MATITEDYISYEVAKLLKEKGFDECIFEFYEGDKIKYARNGKGFRLSELGSGIYYPHITHQMAMKWLREVHYIHIAALCPIVDVDTDVFGVKYNVVISNLKNFCLAFNTDIEDNEYDTYEQAVEAAIKYCLENLI